MNAKFLGSVIVAALFAYWGTRHLRFSLPDVRARVQAGTASDSMHSPLRAF
jgi:hypothetical protein